jgi:hypothetical protein
MPAIPSLSLTNKLPQLTYQYLVTTSSSFATGSSGNPYTSSVIVDGLGNQLTFLQSTASYSISSSWTITSSYEYISVYSITSSWATSASFASQSITSSYLSGPATGSLFGTSSWAINSVTASFISSSLITGSFTGSYVGVLSGSFTGSASGSFYGTASNAVSNSFGTGIPQIQSSCSALLSNACTQTVTFNRAFPNVNYALSFALSGSSNFLTASQVISSSTTGFTVNFNTSSGYLMWMAVGLI